MSAHAIKNQTPTSIEYEDGHVVRFDSADAPAVDGELVRRYDSSELAKPIKNTAGFLIAEARIQRAGVHVYRRMDGTSWRELRPREEVFAPKALASFALAPVTLEHPPAMLTTETVKTYAVGHLGEPRPDGDHVRAKVMITDKAAIAEAERGKNRISCGYDCRLQKRSGTWTRPDGTAEPFDLVQVGIEGNHAALTTEARGGPTLAMRMDSAAIAADDPHADAFLRGPEPKTPETQTMKIKIDGKDIEVADEVAAHVTRLDSARVAAETQAAAKALEADKLAGTLAAAQAAAEAAKAQDANAKIIEERLELAAVGAEVLGKDFAEVARMDSAAIKVAVIKAASPKIDLAGKSSTFIDSVYEYVTADRKAARMDSASGVVKVLAEGAKTIRGGGGDIEAQLARVNEEARAKAIKEQGERWKQKTA